MRRREAIVTALVIGVFAGGASAVVSFKTAETFDAGVGDGAGWGVGGPYGWQALWEDRGNNSHNEYYGSTGQIVTAANQFPYQSGGESRGQPDPGSHSGAPGTLVVQHMSQWDNGGDPDLSSKQMHYITFPSKVGVVYELSAWVNTTKILWNNPDGTPPWQAGVYPAGDEYGGHPRSVGQQSHYADIQIGLKNGAADMTDLDTVYTVVPGLLDNLVDADAWVKTPTLQAVGDGGPMTILLKLRSADISAGAHSDLDVRWDDIVITPEPTSLALLAFASLALKRRKLF